MRKLLVLLFFFHLSCGSMDMQKAEGFGLPVVQIGMNTENQGLLLGQVQSKRPVDGELRMDGQSDLECNVSFAGQSSLNDFRKSYNFRKCKGDKDHRTRFRLAAQNRDQATVRSIMAYELFAKMNLAVPTTELVSAYMNHDFLGVYLFAEPISIEFYDRRGIKVLHLFQAKFGNSGFRKEFASNVEAAFDYEGDDKDDFAAIRGLYTSLWTTTDDAEFAAHIKNQIDVDNFLSYMATSVFICHWDGFDNNFFMALDERRSKLFLTPWDLDRVWEDINSYQPQDLLVRNEILRRMLAIPEFKTLFNAKIDKLLQDFPLATLLMRVETEHNRVHLALLKDKINGPDEAKHFQELSENIRVWYAKVVAFRTGF